MTRHFLFLQGVASPFFGRLADHLRARGERITKINFCAGDRAYWGTRLAVSYRGTVDRLDDYLQQIFAENDFTDLVLFGSHRPVHRPAIALAEAANVRVHVFEEGYVRPNWVTLERGGVNADSLLPRDPDWYLHVDPQLPRYADGKTAHSDIRIRAAHDLAYHASNGLNPLLYPGYRTHRPHVAAVEYAGWLRRFSALAWRRENDRRRIHAVNTGTDPFFILPLQLNGDTQITLNSRYGGMPRLIDTVLRCFAVHAPAQSKLVIKNHPLDTGLVDYPALLTGLERELGVAGRVIYLETGLLPDLLEHAAGVVTVNSTAGMIALAHGRPMITLGAAIYDLPGLTFQGQLRDFWENAEQPVRRLFRAFRNTVIHTTQVNGDFYTRRGIAMAVTNSDRLLAPQSPLQELMALYPPNLHTADPRESAR